MHRIIVRTLSRELRLHTDNDEAFTALSYLSADPLMPDGERPPVDLMVEPIGKFYRIDPPGQSRTEGSLDMILNSLFRLLGAWFLEDARDAPVLHAGAALLGGRRFAFVGDKAFGKTTLMLKLIEQGVGIEGDEHLVVTANGAITRPRRLHVKESSFEFVPALLDAIRSSPHTTDWAGSRVYACSPAMIGMRWKVADRPIEHLVFVEPNFGGSSVMSPLSPDEAFARLLETAFMPSTNRGGAAARLRILILRAECWRLQVGSLDQALWHLRRMAQQG